MARSPRSNPTEGELAILEILWRRGDGTVRQVHQALQEERDSPTGYTTVLKLMQIMAQKGLLDRDESQRSHVYRPTIQREQTQGSLVGDLIERAFAGSTSELVLRALSAKPASAQELDEIRRFLNKLDKGADR